MDFKFLKKFLRIAETHSRGHMIADKIQKRINKNTDKAFSVRIYATEKFKFCSNLQRNGLTFEVAKLSKFDELF